MSTLKLEVARAITAGLNALSEDDLGISEADVASWLAAPPKPEMGDYSFPCFRLAKALKKGPPQIAGELAGKLATDGIVASATAAGPYVNLSLNTGAAARAVLPGWARGEAPSFSAKSQKVMVEYSQPNTHKAFHVGHMRNVCLGDSLVRALRALGYPVVAANYLGDVGAHIAKCLWWYLDELTDEQRVPPDTGRGEWLGMLYAKATLGLEDLEAAARDGGDAEQAALEATKARMTEILLKLEGRDPELAKIWDETRTWSLDEFDEIYAWCRVVFDRVFYESEVDEPGLKLVQEYLDKGVFIESEGAVGIVNDEVKHMPFFMLRKRDGTGLYSTKDLALAQLKFNEYEIDRSIYVVDRRQSDHFRHVFLTLEKMGFEQAKQCEHVPYDVVELPEGAMSTRKGTVVLFSALRERMMGALEAKLREGGADLSEEEITARAHDVALGAIKYGMLQRDVNQKIVFDMDAWMKFEGNTGPYLQYAAARMASILRKGEATGKALDLEAAPAATDALQEPAERALLTLIDALPGVVQQVAESLRPSPLCHHLYALAKAYSNFYRDCPVLKSEGELLQARLLLVKATREALAYGLDILGIPAPERM